MQVENSAQVQAYIFTYLKLNILRFDIFAFNISDNKMWMSNRITNLLQSTVIIVCMFLVGVLQFLNKSSYSSIVFFIYWCLELSTFKVGFPEKREVRQFQFTAWPDHGVPDHPTAFLMFLRRVQAMNPIDVGPIIVHCR